MVGPGRTLLLRLNGDWIFDAEEQFPAPFDFSARVQIGDFVELGRGLVIDGTVQLTEAVDSLYSTALIFPAALSAGSRRRWLVIGGGDGATPREALRFRDTESVHLVDISPLVIDRTQALIPSFWDGCQGDPRLRITARDAWEVLHETAASATQVDILVYDLSDAGNPETNPFSESAADRLYSEDAFRLAARCLSPGGVFVGQMAELSLLRFADHLRKRQLLKKVFRHVYSYRTFVEPFGYWESFIIASNQDGPWRPTGALPVEERLTELYTGEWRETYSTAWHQQLFALPPYLAKRIC